MQDEHDDSMPGQDSFIDVICNMVGILIILVMIVGVRASRAGSAPRPASPLAADADNPPAAPADPTAQADLETAIRADFNAEQEIKATVLRAVDLRVQSELIEARREKLGVMQAVVEREIDQRRSKLDSEAQRQFDVQRQIVAAEIRLNELTQHQISLLAEATEIEEIECVPTPIAKTVTGEEIHIRLRHEQLAVVPVNELLDEVQRRGGDYIRSGLQSRNEATDVYGPIDGFRMQLSVQKYETSTPGESPLAGPPRAAVVLQGVFLPTSEELGQAVEQALLPSSQFMQTLRARRSAAPTVTVWVYPDSYAELRVLKRAMWESGVPLAVRPLAQGQPIIFSTAGSKSAAQ